MVTRGTYIRATILNFLLSKSLYCQFLSGVTKLKKVILLVTVMNEKFYEKIIPIILATIVLTMIMPSTLGEEDNIQIVCTNSALADFTSNIITENVSIEYIMPAGACPAHFDTSPSDVSKIVNADIIISLGWEPWLTSLLNKSGNTAYTEIKCLGLGEWNIPSGAISYVKTIKNGLKSTIPDQSTSIQQNAEEYLTKINETAQSLQNKIKSLNLTNRKIVCMEWQKDFLEWIGLNVTFYYPPPESLSVQDEIDVINAASQNNVAAIVDNLQSGTEFGARVSSEAGVSHVIFSNFPGAIPATESYLEMITYNTNQLINGITSFDLTTNQTQSLQSQLNQVELQRNAFGITSLIALVLCGILFTMYKKK
jgi:ABC-type Zn uptake system ZnuABC Zn-binding protein ZnuA